MKKVLLFVLLVISAILLASCAQSTPTEPKQVGPIGEATSDFFVDVGPKFAVNPESVTIDGSASITVSVSDYDFVHNRGYIWDGNKWNVFFLTAQSSVSGHWLSSPASATLLLSSDNYPPGTYYLAAYACSRTAQRTFDCNQDKFMLTSFEVEPTQPVRCPPQIEPVCGQDQVTYDNACLMEQAGVEIDYVGPCLDMPAVSTFIDAPQEYVIGSSQSIDFVLGRDYQEADNVIFQVWHYEQGTIQGDMLDNNPPYVYEGSSLDTVSPGLASVQAFLRKGNEGIATIVTEVNFKSEQSTCGNSVKESDEVCDSNTITCQVGGLQGTKTCNQQCTGYEACQITQTGPECGNGIIEQGEQCDDNNRLNGDGCSASCQIESSGNQCNDGIDNDGDGLVDWQFDLGCSGPNDTTERGLYTHDYLTGDKPLTLEDEDGWSTFDPKQGATIYFVTRDGSTTIPANGVRLNSDNLRGSLYRIRDEMQSGDWVLVERGQTFRWDNTGSWQADWRRLSGVNFPSSTIISTFGSSVQRPVIELDAGSSIVNLFNGKYQNIVFAGLHITDPRLNPQDSRYDTNVRTGNLAFRFVDDQDMGNALFEDLKLEWLSTGMTFDATPYDTNVRVRRNVFHAIGERFEEGAGIRRGGPITNGNNNDFLMEGNVFYWGGWHPDLGFIPGDQGQISYGNYMHDARIKHNIFARPGLVCWRNRAYLPYDGDMLGGSNNFIENNLFIHCPVAIAFEVAWPDTPPGTFHVGHTIKNNVITASGNEQDVYQEYGGDLLTNFMEGIGVGRPNDVTIQDNLLINTVIRKPTGRAIKADGGQNTIIDNTIFNYDYDQTAISGSGQVSNNNIDSAASVFVDASRDVTTYNQRIIGRAADYDDFMRQAIMQSRLNWDSRYEADQVNDWIRQGFEQR